MAGVSRVVGTAVARVLLAAAAVAAAATDGSAMTLVGTEASIACRAAATTARSSAP